MTVYSTCENTIDLYLEILGTNRLFETSGGDIICKRIVLAVNNNNNVVCANAEL